MYHYPTHRVLPVAVGAALWVSLPCRPLNFLLHGNATIGRNDELFEEHCKLVSILFDVGFSASKTRGNTMLTASDCDEFCNISSPPPPPSFNWKYFVKLKFLNARWSPLLHPTLLGKLLWSGSWSPYIALHADDTLAEVGSVVWVVPVNVFTTSSASSPVSWRGLRPGKLWACRDTYTWRVWWWIFSTAFCVSPQNAIRASPTKDILRRHH